MRKLFSELLHKEMSVDKDIILITGDLGYGLWDRIRIDYADRFFNAMSSEQLMMGMATGFAMEGKIPIVYSITPFLLYRPFEFIRNYLDNEKIPVKLIGGGRNDEYGYLGFSHWAKDDKKIMSCFKNITTVHPIDEFDLEVSFQKHIYSAEPVYINLKK
jgi:transketolase|tara:strand:- start:265 stop:741 length:477 start_codon:yes stop_codon:yes gene_type:complete